MATIQNLIDQLSEVKDKSQTVVFQYWTADDFSHKPTEEQFAEAADALWADALWQDALEILTEEVARVVAESSEDSEDSEEDEED